MKTHNGALLCPLPEPALCQLGGGGGDQCFPCTTAAHAVLRLTSGQESVFFGVARSGTRRRKKGEGMADMTLDGVWLETLLRRSQRLVRAKGAWLKGQRRGGRLDALTWQHCNFESDDFICLRTPPATAGSERSAAACGIADRF